MLSIRRAFAISSINCYLVKHTSNVSRLTLRFLYIKCTILLDTSFTFSEKNI